MLVRMNTKELMFCYYYVKLQSPKEAAIRAGYSQLLAERTAAKLLMDKKVQEKIKKLSKDDLGKGAPVTAVQGLSRLAFTPANDAVMLAFYAAEITKDQVAELDLYHVSECKKTKDGFEVKFFDRIKALSLLYELSEKQGGESEAVEFYSVLERSAKSLNARDEQVAD